MAVWVGPSSFLLAGAGNILLDVLSLLNPTGGEECGASSLLLLGPPGVGDALTLSFCNQISTLAWHVHVFKTLKSCLSTSIACMPFS